MKDNEIADLAKYWSGGRQDSLSDTELLELAKNDIQSLIAHIEFLNHEVERWKGHHKGVVEAKRRLSQNLGELLKKKFAETKLRSY